ncbi:taurine catabolism dioxygenase [Sulfuricaulis limicola]|uniref:Taurine catabolism dioxygenase n=2 Tax=Sulfuricaulis limicola TaxID=1620215 RepID=A0A1B4XFL4_9GAMM|nr:taurine catabolism dioxygenase [Sulfuricaulis limicola]
MNNPAKAAQASHSMSPFYVENEAAYRRWRTAKLERYPATAEELVVPVDNPLALTEAEAETMLNICRKTNMVIYASRVKREDKEIPRAVGGRFGLHRLDSNMLADDDGISLLQVVPGKSQRGYIPYSDKRLLWHTDGYYNSADNRIRAFVLHCVSPAAQGGENSLLDHEIAYILMRDANPDYVRALMAPDAMTIPANTEGGSETRPAVTGPVFSVDPAGGNLHMRYTARTRSIEWKQDAATRAAVQFLENLLAGASPYVFRHTMAAGQGLMCNNVLHNRTAFTDDAGRGIARLVYRARYYDRVRGTNFNETGH